MMHAGFNLFTGDPPRLDDSMQYIESMLPPLVESQPGSLGISLHADPEPGLAVLEDTETQAQAALRQLTAWAEALQSSPDEYGPCQARGRPRANEAEGFPMTPDPSAVARRDKTRARLRAVTAAAGIASVLTAAGVTYSLPGPAHAATAHAASGSSSASGTGHSGLAKSAGSSSASSGSGSSGSGFSAAKAPSASSGSGQVTSGGS